MRTGRETCNSRIGERRMASTSSSRPRVAAALREVSLHYAQKVEISH